MSRKVKVRGEWYHLVVLRVVEKDELGRPLLCRVMREGDTARLSEDPDANHFHVVLAKDGGGL